MNFKHKPVLVKGEDNLVCSIAACLLNAGHPVVVYTQRKDAGDIIEVHLSDQKEFKPGVWNTDLQVTNALVDSLDILLAIIVTAEDHEAKTAEIRHLQSVMVDDAVIAINTESIALSNLQEGALHPGRIIGMNWSEPAHTTYFLEIISNGVTEAGIADDVAALARNFWNKDPYLLTNTGIRSRMIAAMVREAFYLLENDYVSIEDIDRACRNDAGYYLPFAGHCRYMDLMGTCLYGKVMADLNPELSRERMLPELFNKILREGLGMQSGKGFYVYDRGEPEQRMEEFRKFSCEIREIISRYPFQYRTEKAPTEKKISPSI